MGLSSDAQLVQRVLENPGYRESFRRLARKETVEARDVAHAIVAYELTLGRPPTALQRFLEGDPTALTSAAQSGLRLFTGKAGCASCHQIKGSRSPLTDNLYHSSSLGLRAVGPRLGILIEKLSGQAAAERVRCVEENLECAALGRFAVSLDPKDVGAFRTPSLRAVSQTAPYMHDGSVASLEEALDLELYYQGANRGYPVILSDDERQDLLAFLREL
jgi:cytochrome c peroxidase